MGFADGLVRLVVQTHNNQGIAKGTEICINAGPDFSARHDLANCFQGASEKKFRGALDALFEKQITVQEPEGENQCLAPPLAGAEGFAGGKQIDGQSEDAPAQKRRRVTEKQNAPDSGKDKCKDGQDAKQGEHERQQQQQDAGGTGGSCSGAVLLAEGVGPHNFKVFLDQSVGSAPVLRVHNTMTENKKCPPDTCLLLIRDGQILKTSAEQSGLQYDFKDPKKTVVHVLRKEGGESTAGNGKPLASLVSDLGVQKMAKS